MDIQKYDEIVAASKYFDNKYKDNKKKEDNSQPVEVTVARNITNVVSGDKLRQVQKDTLREAKEYLSKTFGPMGSNTKIIKGNNTETIQSSYSKDGLKVLKNIINSAPIEQSIIEELIDITRHVESKVGDGTTSTVILSSLIFDKLTKIEESYRIPPFQIIRSFEWVVNRIKKSILESKKNCTLDDIYDISMISTNGNKTVSQDIKNIYDKYGLDVNLSVGISNTSDSIVRNYDGLTITEGFSDPVYINNKTDNTADIRSIATDAGETKVHIYYFSDPIDTPMLISYFDAIVQHNIYEPLENDEDPIPTVITCPRISRDMSSTLQSLANRLYQFDNANVSSQKPPILVITNVVSSDEAIMSDIANLCGAKEIKKYIDPKTLEKDQENGNAPTIDNVFDWYGEAEEVVADSKKTKFINPMHMHIIDKDGNVEEDPIYTAMINFLETEIKNSGDENANERGILQKRLSALKANMVDYLVGGVTISERDAIKDLVEDAIKNCKSAARDGVGYAANFEGLYHSCKVMDEIAKEEHDEIEYDIAAAIFESYVDITEILYSSVGKFTEIPAHIYTSIINKAPYDISKGALPDLAEKGTNVKCTIMLDIEVLDTISKIISMMVTCNQCLLQAPQLNNY